MPRPLSRPRALVLALCSLLAGVLPARGELLYLVSKSAGTLVRFDSAATITLADQQASTPVTTLVTGLAQPSGIALGPDGRLYIAEWGDGASIGPRVSRYDIGTGQWTPLVSLDSTTQRQPSAIAFRPTGLGGQMLVGRVGQLDTLGDGGIVQVSDWNTASPTVASTPYNTGISLDGSSGLAVAADGTTFVSNSKYTTVGGFPLFQGDVVRLAPDGGFQQVVIANGLATGGLTGPAGLVLTGTSLYTGSVTNSKVFRTNLTNSTTTEFGSLGPSSNFEIGPLGQLADGSILGGSVLGTATISIFQPDGSLSPQGYYNAGFGTIGGFVVTAVPEPGAWSLGVAGGLAGAWMAMRRGRRRRA